MTGLYISICSLWEDFKRFEITNEVVGTCIVIFVAQLLENMNKVVGMQ